MDHSVKKLLSAFAAISCLSTVSYACPVSVSDTPAVEQIVAHHGGWPISDERCALINKYKLTINVDGEATVLAGTSVGWVIVKLGSSDTNIVSNKYSASTNVNSSTASQDVAEDQFYAALRRALAELDITTAANEVKKFEAKAAKRY